MLWFNITFSLIIVCLLVSVAIWTIQQLAPADQQPAAVRAEWPWLIKGLIAPALFWALMNLGLSFRLQPFMPAIQAAQNANRDWLPLFLHYTAAGLLLIASCWAALTLVWWLIRSYHNLAPELRMEFRSVCFTSIILLSLPTALLLYFGGWFQIGFATVLLAAPMVGYGAPIIHRPKRRPIYSRALARIKMGKYGDAEKEILRQLESSENDFDGWLMLAELHATRFGELAEAEKIILDLCVHPAASPTHISVALQKLADWQLTLAADPEAAARTLKLISDRLPATHLAAMAELRRSQLPTNQEFRARREAKPIRVPVVPSMFAAPQTPASETMDHEAARAQIQQLTATLTQNPNNISDRERLARLLAEPLGKVDLAIEQIELLLGMDAQPDVKCTEWLMLIAHWQSQLLQDETAANATLTKLIEKYPSTPQAFTAQRRLSLLKAEAAARRT